MLFVIFNPNAGQGAAARREGAVRAALQAVELPFELVHTERVGHARELAAQAAAAHRYRVVVAVGGDGTINEVVNGLLGSDTPLGLMPIGTGNDFVKMIDLAPNQPKVAAERLRDGVVRPVDVGVANGRAFLDALGTGFAAQVTVETLRPTRLRGFAVYLVALVRALAHYKSPVMRVSYENQTIEQRMLLTAVGNGRCQGGGFWVTPDAIIDDGLLDLCVCGYMRTDEILRHVPKVLKGTHGRLKQVQMARVRHVTIEARAGMPVHLDGELLGIDVRHVDVEVRPGAITLLA